jgi:hypothetical protein
MWNCWPLFKFYFQKHSFNVKKKYVDCIIFFPTDYYSTSWVLKHFPSGVVWLWNLLYYSCTMKTQGSHPVSNFEA